KRIVQRWESGTTTARRPLYTRALESGPRLPIAALGFPTFAHARISDDVHRGLDHEDSHLCILVANASPAPQATPRGNLSGIWLSTYEYVSSGRGNQVFTGKHHVVLLQHGNRLTGRSLPGASLNPDSPLTLDLQVEGSTVTGTW